MKNKAQLGADGSGGKRKDEGAGAREPLDQGGTVRVTMGGARESAGESRGESELEIRSERRKEMPVALPVAREAVGRLVTGASEQVEGSDPAEIQRRRIRKLRQEAEEICGGGFTGEGIDRLPPDMEEAFWQQIIAYERAEPCNLFELLTTNGVSLPETVLISEEHLSDRLWEVIYFLSSQGCYIENTDHLSDRELYALLRDRLLHEPAIIFPDDPNYAFHLDTIGSGSAEDQQIYLTYYATETDRELWAKSWPEDPLPPRIPCPYDRDRLLPRPYLRDAEQFM